MLHSVSEMNSSKCRFKAVSGWKLVTLKYFALSRTLVPPLLRLTEYRRSRKKGKGMQKCCLQGIIQSLKMWSPWSSGWLNWVCKGLNYRLGRDSRGPSLPWGRVGYWWILGEGFLRYGQWWAHSLQWMFPNLWPQKALIENQQVTKETKSRKEKKKADQDGWQVTDGGEGNQKGQCTCMTLPKDSLINTNILVWLSMYLLVTRQAYLQVHSQVTHRSLHSSNYEQHNFLLFSKAMSKQDCGIST